MSFSIAPILISVPPIVVAPVNPSPAQIGAQGYAASQAALASNAAALAQQTAAASAAITASNAAAAQQLAAAAATSAAARIVLTGQSNSYAPGTAPGTVGSLSAGAANTGLLSPAGESNLASRFQSGNSTALAAPPFTGVSAMILPDAAPVFNIIPTLAAPVIPEIPTPLASTNIVTAPVPPPLAITIPTPIIDNPTPQGQDYSGALFSLTPVYTPPMIEPPTIPIIAALDAPSYDNTFIPLDNSFNPPIDLSMSNSTVDQAQSLTATPDTISASDIIPAPWGVRSLIANATSSIVHAMAFGTLASTANNGAAQLIADTLPAAVMLIQNGIPADLTAAAGIAANADPFNPGATVDAIMNMPDPSNTDANNAFDPYANYDNITSPFPLVNTAALLLAGATAAALGGSALGAMIFTGASFAESLIAATISGDATYLPTPGATDSATAFLSAFSGPSNGTMPLPILNPDSNYAQQLMASASPVSDASLGALISGALAGAAVGGGIVPKLATPLIYTAIMDMLSTPITPLDTTVYIPPFSGGMSDGVITPIELWAGGQQ